MIASIPFRWSIQLSLIEAASSFSMTEVVVIEAICALFVAVSTHVLRGVC